MRIFIAVNIPEEVKDGIEALQRDLKRARADVKWVGRDNLHITMKFIGDASEDKPGVIRDALERSLKQFGSFKTSLKGAGAFPNPASPRVVWIGAGEGAGRLKELAGRIEDCLAEAGFDRDERGFTAHLTLGRTRSGENRELLSKRIAGNSGAEAGYFEVKSVDIMQSVLRPEGPEYICLNSISIS